MKKALKKNVEDQKIKAGLICKYLENQINIREMKEIYGIDECILEQWKQQLFISARSLFSRTTPNGLEIEENDYKSLEEKIKEMEKTISELERDNSELKRILGTIDKMMSKNEY